MDMTDVRIVIYLFFS